MKKLILLFILIAFNSNAASMKMIGSKGDPNDVSRIIKIKMYDNYYEPNKYEIKISRIAFGIPLNGELGYLDSDTISHAFNERKEL